MIKTALQYVIGLAKPVTVEVDGKQYATENLHRLDGKEDVAALTVRNLRGMVDYVKSNFDHEEDLLIHIESPTRVSLYDALDDKNDRRCYLVSQALLPDIQYGRYLSREAMTIQLQSTFVPTEESKLIIDLLSSAVQNAAIHETDDGLSQTVAMRKGISLKERVEIPNPIELKPIRTFVDVTQPSSSFLLRLKQTEDQAITAALFEADGGAWELNGMQYIKNYFEEALQNEIETGKVKIIG